MSKYACALLWTHAAVNMDKKMKPCCRFRRPEEPDYSYPLLSDGFNKGFHGSTFENIRKRMLAGEALPECKKCLDRESVGLSSMRTEYNEKYQDYIGKNIDKLKYLEIGFSTHCNLSCRMCDETSSSTIHKIKYPKQHVELDFGLDVNDIDIDISELDEIKIVGGEPMMSPSHVQFLDKLLHEHNDLSKLQITYHTNCTVRPSKHVIDFWRKVGRVHLSLSIDGFGRTNEIQRAGSTWSKLLYIFDLYKSLCDEGVIQIGTHTVVTPINIMKLDELFDFFSENSEYIVRSSVDACVNRSLFDIRNMNNVWKKQATDYISNSESIPNRHKKMLLAILKQDSEYSHTIHDINDDEFQQQVNTYFSQSLIDYDR